MTQTYEFYVLANKDCTYFVKDNAVGIVGNALEAEKYGTAEEAETIRKYRADKDIWHVYKVELTAHK